MKNFYRVSALWVVLYFSIASPAFAEFSYGPLSLSAFGTLGGAWLSNEHADYAQGAQPSGPGMTHDIDLGLDSRLGAQLNIALTPSTLITAQTVVERLPDNSFAPRLTQANIRQELGENLVLRVGRIQNPAFLASDYRLANFSNPWVRTPGALYNLYPLTHLDSAEFTYRHTLDWGVISLNAGYGWFNYPIATIDRGATSTAEITSEDVVYANLKLDQGPWRFKFSWLRGRTSVHVQDIDQLVAGVASMDPVAAKQLEAVNKGANLYAAGFSYDNKDWLVMGEWAISLADEAYVYNDRHGGYLTVGYHLGRWLPQITLGYQASTNQRVHSLNQDADAMIDYVHIQQRSDYRTVAVGLSYAITDAMMLRGQADVIEPMKNSMGPYFQTDTTYKFNDPGVDVLFSLTLDFVY